MPVVQCNGADLYYEDHGEGQPIVFLHGATAGLRYFEPQLRGLSDDYRAAAFDFRGNGRSEKTELGHTFPGYARDLRAFLEALDVDDAVVAGWSMGALVDVEMEPSPLKREGYEHGSYDVEGVGEALVGIQTDPLGELDASIDALVKGPPSRELRTMMFDEGSRIPPPIQAATLFEVMRDYREVLPEVDVPTLVCAGADETWRSVASVEYAADLLPDAEFELFENSGHCPTDEEPERFNRALRGFVDSP